MATNSQARMLSRAVFEPCRRALLEPLGSADPIHEVGDELLQLMQQDAQAVADVAHAMLHAHPFSSVPLRWRRCFEEAQLWMVARTAIAAADAAPAYQLPIEEQVELALSLTIHRLDMALILTGAPLRQALIQSLLNAARSVADLDGLASTPEQLHDTRHTVGPACCVMRDSRHATAPVSQEARLMFPRRFSQGSQDGPIVGNPVRRLEHPSLLDFEGQWRRSNAPAVLTETLSHWPACSSWTDPSYWMQVTIGGRRLVPVEIGRSYTDDDWGQTIMPFHKFMTQYLLGEDVDSDGHPQGYLAQHDLLAQVPDLRRDIAIPDYCYVEPPVRAVTDVTDTAPSKSQEPSEGQISSSLEGAALDDDSTAASEDSECSLPSINIWLGPAGTVSPAHTDPHHNILAQVVGRKYVRLFAPSEGAKLYPMDGGKGDLSPDPAAAQSEGHPGLSSEDDTLMHASSLAKKRKAECLDESREGSHPHNSQRTNGKPYEYEGSGDAAPRRPQDYETDELGDGNSDAAKPVNVNMSNTSRVDVGLSVEWPGLSTSRLSDGGLRRRRRRRAAQAERFPRFESAHFVDTILEPGDSLFIPRGWWHYVTSLDVSCSVSFWWD